MNPGTIWWGQIGNSLRLLSKVTNALRDCHSAVLQVPQKLPWRHEFYNAVEVRRSAFGAERRLRRLQWEENTDPGEFVLDELCSNKTRADYWPGLSYAAYLASRDDIVLNDYYVWITGIHSKTDISKWSAFVADYVHHCADPNKRAVFILEYDGVNTDFSGVEKILYCVENYDCRVFALEIAASLSNAAMRNYQAELALSICSNNPEFCYELLLQGNKLLEKTMSCVWEVISNSRDSDRRSFPPMTESQIQSAAWEASIVLMFPILERYRMGFIGRHQAQLSRRLPVTNSFGEKITETCDLELADLCHIVNQAGSNIPTNEAEAIRLCRRIRNLLAHNNLVSYEDVQKLLAL